MQTTKLDYKKTALIGLAFMTISAFWQLYNNEVPLMLEEMIGSDRQFVINMIMSLDNITALFLLPFFGSLSDRVNTRIGKRMPFIIIGTVVSVVFMLIMPIAFSKGSLIAFFISVGGLLLSMSFYRSPAVALMPDVTPKPLRSAGNAVINLMGAVGLIFIQFMTIVLGGEKNYAELFTAVALFMLMSLVVMFFTVDENKLVAQMPVETETEEERVARENQGIKIAGGERVSLFFLLVSVFLWYMAYSAIETNYTRYAKDIWGLTDGAYSKPMLFASIVALVSFVPIGVLSNRFGRKKTILGALGVLLAAVVITAFIRGYTPVLYVLFALIGVSWAAINVNSYPMVVEMSRGADVGKYTGLYYTFSMAAQIATPVITGFMFDLFGRIFNISFEILFPYAALFLFVAIITMIFVRHGEAAPEAEAKSKHDMETVQNNDAE